MERFFPILVVLALWAGPAPAADINSLTDTINALSEHPERTAEAARAMRELSQAGPDDVLLILKAMRRDQPIASNWLRGAVESIVDRNPGGVSDGIFTKFLLDTHHAPAARALAFQLLKQQNEEKALELIPKFVEDPSLELRYLAVDKLRQDAKQLSESGKKEEAIELYKQAIQVARSEDQVNQLAAALRDLGEEIDLNEQFGYLPKWYMIAAFDFSDGRGFETAYPPEEAFDLDASYAGKKIPEIEGPAVWREFKLEPNKSYVDFNEVYAPVKEVVGYAYTTFESEKAQEVEFRWSSPNGTKVWLNGELVGSSRIYHAGEKFDQYTAKVTLKKGTNTILVKVVQNEQTQSWTNKWHFQFRITDELGTPIPPATASQS